MVKAFILSHLKALKKSKFSTKVHGKKTKKTVSDNKYIQASDIIMATGKTDLDMEKV